MGNMNCNSSNRFGMLPPAISVNRATPYIEYYLQADQHEFLVKLYRKVNTYTMINMIRFTTKIIHTARYDEVERSLLMKIRDIYKTYHKTQYWKQMYLLMEECVTPYIESMDIPHQELSFDGRAVRNYISNPCDEITLGSVGTSAFKPRY